MSIKTDRSRIESYQRCPQRRWLEYERKDNGMTLGGFRPNRPAFALEIGSGFHKAMEVILSCCKKGQPPPDAARMPLIIEEGITSGIESYDKEILPFFENYHVNNRGFMAAGAENEEEEYEVFNNYTVDEGRALVEALTRVYCAAPAGLTALLDEYEVLEVEQEIDVPLDTRPCGECDGHGNKGVGIKCRVCNGTGSYGDVILMSRPDGILRHRKDGQLYVLSFKTTGKWDKRKADSGKYDIEGISQLIAAEHKYGEQFAAVQMVYVVKGYKMKDKFDDTWKTYNGVIRPYLKRGVTGDDDQYSFSYDYVKDTGEAGKLGKGWEKINIWEQGDGALKQWVEQLKNGRWPQDKYGHIDHLDKMVIMPPPFWRDETTMEAWKEEVIVQESRIAMAANRINTYGAQVYPDMPLVELKKRGEGNALNHYFPKYRHSCSYPTPCAFIPVCHEGVTLLESGMFTPREANHPQETEK